MVQRRNGWLTGLPRRWQVESRRRCEAGLRFGFLPLLMLATTPAFAAPGAPRVRIETTAGAIVIELAMKQAPITAGNFLRYADEKRLDGTTFYRAARSKADPKAGLVQGGINHHIPRALPPIKHEPTSVTGLHHIEGTVSMARNAPGTAMGDFFIIVGSAAYLDARPNSPGYAAFGHVVSGMPLVKRILAMPTFPGGFSRDTMGQTIREPLRIVSVRRVK
jgi:peptidyl-prolyl cis-trans isomerase A (cyclophilin A)